MRLFRSLHSRNAFTSSFLYEEGVKRITGRFHDLSTACCWGENRRFFLTSSPFCQARNDVHLPSICKNSMAALRATGKAWQYQAISKQVQNLLNWVKDGVGISSSDSERTHSVCNEENSAGCTPPLFFSSTSLKGSHLSGACGFASTSFEWEALLDATPFAKSPVIVQGLFLLGAQAGIAVLHEKKMQNDSLASPEMSRSSFSINSNPSSDISILKEKVNTDKEKLFLPPSFIVSQWVQSLVQDILPLLYFFTLFPHLHYNHSNSPGTTESVLPRHLSENDSTMPKKSGTSPYFVPYASQCMLLQWILYTWVYTLFHFSPSVSNDFTTSISSPLSCIFTQVVTASEVIVKHLQKHRNSLENMLPTLKNNEKERCEVEQTLAQVKETHKTLISLTSGLPLFTVSSSPYHLLSSDKSEKAKVMNDLAHCIERYLFLPEEYLLAHHSSLLHVTQPFSLAKAVGKDDGTHKNCFGPVEVDHSWVEHMNALLTYTATSCN